MSNNPPSKDRYYPTEKDMASPAKARSVLQQVLKQHYELVDAHAALQTAHAATLAQVKQLAAQPSPGGPTNTILLGLPVAPIDSGSLANGATLKYDKVNGQWKFS